jgi:CMP/dCMP kinase
MIIALDGPSASGKGVVGKRLANHFNLAYLDTGLVYRAVAYKHLQQKLDIYSVQDALKVAKNLQEHDLHCSELRLEEVGNLASILSAYPEVRKALFDFQQKFAYEPHEGKYGSLLDGRDIGTVICPDADVKIFVTADVETRAKRRFLQLQEQELEVSYDQIFEALEERDARDKLRAVSPLIPSHDAFIVDTTHMDLEEVEAFLVAEIESHMGAKKRLSKGK